MRRLNIIAKLLQSHKKFLITTHVRPDGDAIGAELALYSLLEQLDKEVFIVNQDPTPQRYSFLPHSEKIQQYSRCKLPDKMTQVAIIVDCNEYSRIGKVKELLRGSPIIINIDHHEGVGLSDYTYISSKASSSCELIYQLITTQLHIRYLTKDVSLCLYVGLMTDSGSFSHSNTNSQTFYIASKLLECGVNASDVAQRIFANKSAPCVGLLGYVLSTVKVHKNIAYCILKKDAFEKFNLKQEDFEVEDVLSQMYTIKEADVFFLLRELSDGQTKVSLRARNKDILSVAREFGGGGHRCSASCTLNLLIPQAQQVILDELLKR